MDEKQIVRRSEPWRMLNISVRSQAAIPKTGPDPQWCVWTDWRQRADLQPITCQKKHHVASSEVGRKTGEREGVENDIE